jgi:hypothetical protein
MTFAERRGHSRARVGRLATFRRKIRCPRGVALPGVDSLQIRQRVPRPTGRPLVFCWGGGEALLEGGPPGSFSARGGSGLILAAPFSAVFYRRLLQKS